MGIHMVCNVVVSSLIAAFYAGRYGFQAWQAFKARYLGLGVLV